MELKVNKEKKRFETAIEESTAFIDYILNTKNIMFLTHTEVPEELGGKGVGRELVAASLDYIASKDYQVAPLCPFVAKFMKKNPDYNHLLAPGYNIT